MTLDRRSFLRRSSIGVAAAGAVAAGLAPAASAQSSMPGLPPLPNLLPTAAGPITGFGTSPRIGTTLDYSAGVPAASAVRAAGHLGAVRYCSNRRPDAQWMAGKPLLRREADDFRANGLTITSCYQYGKAETADWLGGAGAGDYHAPIGIGLHFAAGGARGAAIYVAIDDSPTRAQFDNQIAPYLQRWDAHLRGNGLVLGVYCNAPTIDWCRGRNIGTYYWQHGWGSGGRIHPLATMYQRPGALTTVSGIDCDINDVYSGNYGQWGAAAGAPTASPTINLPGIAGLPQLNTGSAGIN